MPAVVVIVGPEREPEEPGAARRRRMHRGVEVVERRIRERLPALVGPHELDPPLPELVPGTGVLRAQRLPAHLAGRGDESRRLAIGRSMHRARHHRRDLPQQVASVATSPQRVRRRQRSLVGTRCAPSLPAGELADEREPAGRERASGLPEQRAIDRRLFTRHAHLSRARAAFDPDLVDLCADRRGHTRGSPAARPAAGRASASSGCRGSRSRRRPSPCRRRRSASSAALHTRSRATARRRAHARVPPRARRRRPRHRTPPATAHGRAPPPDRSRAVRRGH